MTIAELFRAARLSPCRPVGWGKPVKECGPGIYVIAEKPGRIIYIGRSSRSIAKRMEQFYCHKYGAKSPHRGGQEILLLNKPRSVYWAQTKDFRIAESRMIAAFEEHAGKLPYGNKKRGVRLSSNRQN